MRRSDLVRLLVLLLVLRLIIVLLIGWIAGGQQFTDDTRFQLAFIDDPTLLLGPRPDSVYRPPFPPLVPLLMAAAVAPFRWVTSDFYALRIGYSVFELCSFPLLWLAWGRFSRTRVLRWSLGLAYVLSPLSAVATPVLAQEETIAMLFAALAVWLVLSRRLAAAALVCGLGVVAGKVFFLVPLLAVVGGPAWRPWGGLVRRAAWGAAPILLVYGWVWLGGAAGPGSNSFDRFVPPNSMCVSIYSLLEMHGGWNRETSLMVARPLSAAAILTVFFAARWRGPIEAGPWLVALMGAMLLALYATFSHINPEHWLLVVPALPFVFRHRTTVWVFLLHFGVAVAISVTYGVASASGFSEGRGPFVALYERWVPVPAVRLHAPLVLLFVATSCGLAFSAGRRVTTRQTIGQPRGVAADGAQP